MAERVEELLADEAEHDIGFADAAVAGGTSSVSVRATASASSCFLRVD